MSELDKSLAALRRSADTAQKLLDATASIANKHLVSSDPDALPQWVVRLTWEVVRGLPHPKHTYSNRATESLAIDFAVNMMDRYESSLSLLLVEAHVKGPGQQEWVRVE